MSSSGSLFSINMTLSYIRSRNALFYLLEPVLIAIVVVFMFSFIPKPLPLSNTRLLELHAQDVLAAVQKDGSVSGWLAGDPSHLEKDLTLVQSLNPNYKYHFSISDGEKTLFSSGQPVKGITARRTYVSESPLLLELTLSF